MIRRAQSGPRASILAVALICLPLAVAAGTQAPPGIVVPSGQQVALNEVLIDETMGALWVRFRFVAPQIGRKSGDIGVPASVADMDYLCDHLAVPYLADHALDAARVVISLADRVVPFGAADPQATQFFGAYRLLDRGCEWEEY